MRRLRRILVVDVAYLAVLYCYCSSCSHYVGAGGVALSCGVVEHISIMMIAMMMMMSAAVKLDVCMDIY
jgi:hypothetical protein